MKYLFLICALIVMNLHPMEMLDVQTNLLEQIATDNNEESEFKKVENILKDFEEEIDSNGDLKRRLRWYKAYNVVIDFFARFFKEKIQARKNNFLIQFQKNCPATFEMFESKMQSEYMKEVYPEMMSVAEDLFGLFIEELSVKEIEQKEFDNLKKWNQVRTVLKSHRNQLDQIYNKKLYNKAVEPYFNCLTLLNLISNHCDKIDSEEGTDKVSETKVKIETMARAFKKFTFKNRYPEVQRILESMDSYEMECQKKQAIEIARLHTNEILKLDLPGVKMVSSAKETFDLVDNLLAKEEKSVCLIQ